MYDLRIISLLATSLLYYSDPTTHDRAPKIEILKVLLTILYQL